MRCPFCRTGKTRVVNSRSESAAKSGYASVRKVALQLKSRFPSWVARERVCKECGRKVVTVEITLNTFRRYFRDPGIA